MLNRNDLHIIETISRLGTVTRAAQELCLTQSAISHAMRRLESQQNVAIWEREGRNVHLTEAGRHLLAFAKRVLPQFEQMELELASFANGEQGKLRLGMECYPCFQWLLKVVGPFLKLYPDVDVDVLREFQFGGLAALFNREIDILLTPDPIYREGLEYSRVLDFEQVLVVSSEHSLLEKDFVAPEDLSNEILLTYPVETSRLDIFTDFLLPAGIRPTKHKHVETTEILLQMVSAERGVTVLPRWLVEEYQAEFDIDCLPLGRTGIVKSLYLGQRQVNAHPAFHQAFVRMAGGDQ